MDQRWVRRRARFAQVPSHAPDVGFGSNSEVGGRNREVRCAPVNGHREAAPACPKGAMREHQTIQNEHRFGLINIVWLALSDTHLFPYSVNT